VSGPAREAEEERSAAAARAGPGPALDRDGVERMYRTHGHVVLRRARAMLGSEADAQEVLHELFAALLRDPGALRAAGSAVAWLYRATTHRCLNVLRGRRSGAEAVERHLASVTQVAGGSAGALSEVRSVLARLADEEGAALVYHHLDGLTYDEIAAQLGCSRRKVGYLLARAQGLVAERADGSPPEETP
jgi:RNA polymerase sigma-70 factor (ECF subfamily)